MRTSLKAVDTSQNEPQPASEETTLLRSFAVGRLSQCTTHTAASELAALWIMHSENRSKLP